ncbi:MAG: epimerase, partial [Sulfurovum sp.]
MKTVVIAGVSGFIGTHLKNHFIKKGFSVSSIGIETYKNENKLLSILEDADIVINLSGANIIHRWS